MPSTARPISCGLRKSPWTNSTSLSTLTRFSFFPVLKLSKTRTELPRFTKASTICEPINPAPPVTKHFIVRLSPFAHYWFGPAGHGERGAAESNHRRVILHYGQFGLQLSQRRSIAVFGGQERILA